MSTHHLYPPFPSDLPTAGLVSVSFDALQDPSTAQLEASKLFAACKDLGFFYLKLDGSDVGNTIIQEVEQLHELQQEFYALPHEEKDRFGRDKIDPFFSYRWTACQDGAKDAWGRPGRREMYSLRVDDFLDVRPPLDQHDMIKSSSALFKTFSKHCRQVVDLLLSALEGQLQVPVGTLRELHKDDKPRGDFIAIQHRAAEPVDDAEVQKGEHTDFGSITMLFNWLGGLQIRDQSPGQERQDKWVWVKPVPGSCIINIADSLVKLTAGILKSNIHRVAQSPGEQAGLPRYSLVYFAHPNDDVELKPVKGGLVDVAAAESSGDGIVATAEEWTTRRSVGDLRGVYTYKNGIELREMHDAIPVASRARINA